MALPDSAHAGDAGHIVDHNLIVDAIEELQGLLVRAVVVKATGSLVNGAREQSTVSFAGCASYRILKVESTKGSRVRLYTTTVKQAADATRPAGGALIGDHGVVLDVVATPTVLSLELSPIAHGYVPASNGIVPITIDNLHGTTEIVTVTFTYMKTG